MVHKNSKWNISLERGEEIAHKYIIEILEDSKNNMTSLSELIISLNQRTRHIKLAHHKKKKPIHVYLKCVYGSVINFLDSFDFYGIIHKNNDIYVKLFDSHILKSSNMRTLHNDWIILDEDEFIIV